MEGCSGILSALAAEPGRGDPKTVEYRSNVNLLRAARSTGASRFVYSSALMADHPLAQNVGELREKARFEEELAGAEGLSYTILRPAMFMENLLLALRGPVAFVPGRHELAGPDSCTFGEAYSRLARARGKRIAVLHPPLFTMRVPGRFLPYVGDLARMFALFDAAGYAADPAPLRNLFGVEALAIE